MWKFAIELQALLWQGTDKGFLEGYDAGWIDINLFKGDYNSFMKYINNK